MADQYEIREDSSKKNWPFTVFNLTKGWEVGDRFVTREDAQAKIDQLSKPIEIDMDLFNMIPDPDDPSWGQAQPPEQKETENVITIDSQERVGSIIEFHGDKWLVVSSRYITAKEATEIEEMHDAYVQPGWDTVIRKVMNDGDAVVVTGSGYGIIVRQDEKTIRVRYLTGTEEDVDSRYVEPAAPSMTEQIKAQVRQ